MTTARIKEIVQQPINNGSNWMGALNTKMKLSDITLLGGHDSITDLQPNNPLSPDIPLPKALLWMMRHVPFIDKYTRKQIVKWSEAQSRSAAEQFDAGARYFDLRVAKDVATGEFYTVHGLLSTDSLMKSLTQINEKLDKHKSEIVILDFRTFMNMPKKADHNNLVSLIKNVFGNKLASSQFTPDSRLKDFLQQNKRVIAIYHNSAIEDLRYNDRSLADNHHDYLWSGHTISSPWPNKSNVSALKKFLNNIISHRQQDNCLNVTQAVLTPSAGTVIKGTIFEKIGFLKKWAPSSLAHLASEANPAISASLSSTWANDSINIIIFDQLHTLKPGFINEIIERNHDTASNLGLVKLFDEELSNDHHFRKTLGAGIALEEFTESIATLDNASPIRVEESNSALSSQLPSFRR